MSEEKSKTSAAIEGAQLVMRSKYLAAIVGIMAFYEMASQVVDYQFSSLTEGVSGETENPSPFDRINRLRRTFLNTEWNVDHERACLVTEGYQKYNGSKPSTF